MVFFLLWQHELLVVKKKKNSLEASLKHVGEEILSGSKCDDSTGTDIVRDTTQSPL